MTEDYEDNLFLPIAAKCLASGTDDEHVELSTLILQMNWIVSNSDFPFDWCPVQ